MTSNQHPQSLYVGGLNRHIYLPPLLRRLKQSTRILSLNADGNLVDYRENKTSNGGIRGWRFSLQENSLEKMFGNTRYMIALTPTRTMSCGTRIDNQVYVDMNDLINFEYSESDYLILASCLCKSNLSLVIYITTRFMSIDILERARRFCKLVEVLYDQKSIVKFISAYSVQELFDNIELSENLENALGESVDSLASSLASSAVIEAIRSIERCISRLKEGCIG